MESRKYTKTSARFPQHARAEPAGSAEVGFIPCFMLQTLPLPVLPSFPFPGRTLLLLPPGYEKAVQTQPVSSGLPLGAVSDLYPLGFFLLLLLLIRPLLYLFTAGCLFFY